MTKAAVLPPRWIIQRNKEFSECKMYASISLSFSDQPTVLATEYCGVIIDELFFSYLLPLIICTMTTQMERAPQEACLIIQWTPSQWCNGHLHRSIIQRSSVSASGHRENTELTYLLHLINIQLRNCYEHFWWYRYWYSVSIQCYLLKQSLEKNIWRSTEIETETQVGALD